MADQGRDRGRAGGASSPAPARPRPGRGRAEGALPGADTSWVLLVSVVAVLCLIGLVMVLSSSSVQALRRYGSSWLFFRRQLLWVLGGSVALVAVARLDYHVWRRLAPALVAVAGVLLVVVLVPGAGITVSGSTRWLGVGGWRMQPSELAKLALLVFSADVLARRPVRPPPGHPGPARTALGPVLALFAVLAVLVLRQPDMGTTVVLGCVALALLYVAGTPLGTMSALVATAAAAGFVVGMAEPYRRARMLSFLNPWADAGNTGYQVVQSLVGLGTGQLTGVGLGASRAKWGFLPNAHTDFVFTVIGEELGLLGSLLVVGLFVAFAVLGIRAALKAPDRFGMLLAAGVTAWVVGQAFVNMGAVVGLLPVTGVPLPFVSFGGSSLAILMVAVGILLNVASQGARAGSGSAAPARAPAAAGRGPAVRGRRSPRSGG